MLGWIGAGAGYLNHWGYFIGVVVLVIGHSVFYVLQMHIKQKLKSTSHKGLDENSEDVKEDLTGIIATPARMW